MKIPPQMVLSVNSSLLSGQTSEATESDTDDDKAEETARGFAILKLVL